MKNRILVIILPVLACFALLPGAQAVSPAPDGCYPKLHDSGRVQCPPISRGWLGKHRNWLVCALSAGDSNYNTGVGGGALALNTGDSNTAVGAAALLLNTTGGQNTPLEPTRSSLMTAGAATRRSVSLR